MKNLMTKRIPVVFITAVILFITIFSMTFFAGAVSKNTYSPRLSAPDKNNQYYYSDKNIFYKYGYGMPNCTAYAYGRAYEILKKAPDLCPYNAEEWYDYNKSNKYYSYGQTPKLGAVACWSYDGGGGHVAVVEKIEKGKITFSNSAWSGENFYLHTADIDDSNAGGSSWWNFQGYIYIGDFESSTQPTTAANDDYSTGIYKTQIDDFLNMRSGAGTSYSVVASIPNGVSLTVTEIKKGSDGYVWGFTSYKDKKGWVALEFCVFVSSQQPTTEKIEPTTVTTVPPTTVPTTTEKETVPPTTEKETEPPTTAQPTTRPKPGVVFGDTNSDGVLTIDDATLVQKYLSELTEFNSLQRIMADFNCDGSITIEDVTEIQKYISN